MQVALDSFVLARVKLAIEQTTYIGDRVVTPETRLTSDLALGKFARLKLTMYLEEEFDIELSDEASERFATVADVAKYIGGHYFRDVELSCLADAA